MARLASAWHLPMAWIASASRRAPGDGERGDALGLPWAGEHMPYLRRAALAQLQPVGGKKMDLTGLVTSHENS